MKQKIEINNSVKEKKSTFHAKICKTDKITLKGAKTVNTSILPNFKKNILPQFKIIRNKTIKIPITEFAMI